MNRLLDAIAVLERGVAVAPQVWILWEYLGHYLVQGEPKGVVRTQGGYIFFQEEG
ncbi:MAG: hypothetical protein K6U77_06600 [Armatimonadetes bacterium]|nr:hypothetical protein [Armatimonadota bacterium]